MHNACRLVVKANQQLNPPAMDSRIRTLYFVVELGRVKHRTRAKRYGTKQGLIITFED